MPSSHIPSAPNTASAPATANQPWRHMLPSYSEATPSTTVAAYSASELSELPSSDPSTGVAVIPVRGANQILMQFWSSEANNTTRTVQIFGLRFVQPLTSQAFTPPQELGGVWRPSAMLSPSCIVGDQAVGAGTAGRAGTGNPTDGRWIDDITISSLDFTSNPPGAQVRPATGTNAGVTRTLQFDATGAEHLVLFLPSGWNGHYTII